MTQQHKGYGYQTPFDKWCRGHKEMDSFQKGLTINDVDYIFHKYKTNVDCNGTRDVQCCMWVELKTRSGEVNRFQKETLFYHHQLLDKKCRVKRLGGDKISLWHFGVYILKLPQESPCDSMEVEWGRFCDNGDLNWSRVLSSDIHKLLIFDYRPDNFKPLSIRRHHKTRSLIIREKMDLGFYVDVKVKKKS